VSLTALFFVATALAGPERWPAEPQAIGVDVSACPGQGKVALALTFGEDESLAQQWVTAATVSSSESIRCVREALEDLTHAPGFVEAEIDLGPLAERTPLDLWMLELQADGTGLPPAAMSASWEASCEDWTCDWTNWHSDDGLPDLKAIRRATEPRCEAGEAAACLVTALAQVYVSPGVYGRSHEIDRPATARKRMTVACDAGLARACTELGHFDALGIGGPAMLSESEERFRAQCDAGEPAACVVIASSAQGNLELEAQEEASAALKRALDLGHTAALGEQLGLLSGDELTAAAVAGCDAGVVRSCPVAAQRTDDLWFATRGCELGDALSCRLVAAELAPRGAQVDALLGWACEAGDEASCPELWLSRRGELPLKDMGYLRPDVVGVRVSDHRPAHHACLVDALFVQPDIPRGRVEVGVRIDGDGYVTAVHVGEMHSRREGKTVTEQTPTALAECLGGSLAGVRVPAPEGGPISWVGDVELDHAAAVEAASLIGSEGTAAARELGTSLLKKRVELDGCYLDNRTEEALLGLTLEVLAVRRRVKKAKVVESSGVEAIDACVVGMVSATSVEKAMLSTRIQVDVDFLRDMVVTRRAEAEVY